MAYQFQELVDLALRSGIVVNTVSTRGVTTENMDEYPWIHQMRYSDRAAQEAPLEELARDTGGMFHSGNDFHQGLRDIARRQAHFYILSYNMSSKAVDGAFHKIRLEVDRPGLQISCRKGYYTQKEEVSYETRKKEDIIAAIDSPANMNEVPVTLSYNYSQEDDSTYAVSFITSVSVQQLQFIEEDARRKNMISLILAAYDENDRFISGVEKSIDLRLLEQSYRDIREQGLTSKVEIKLPVGQYKIKAVVREGNQGKMGSVTKSIEIP